MKQVNNAKLYDKTKRNNFPELTKSQFEEIKEE